MLALWKRTPKTILKLLKETHQPKALPEASQMAVAYIAANAILAKQLLRLRDQRGQ
jgi:hypothetical protein